MTSKAITTVSIRGTDLQKVEYKGEPVVTFAQVDEVHRRPTSTARRTFNDHKHRFIKEVDYFVCNTYEASELLQRPAPRGVNLLTRRGYLKLVKPMNDDRAWEVQLARIKSDPILSEGMTVTVIPSPGGAQETTVLKLELVNGWLFTIDESRVKDEETRLKVLAYKREGYQVLYNHFYGRNDAQLRAEEEPHESESVKIRMVNECRQVFGNKAGAQLWFKIGLPVVPEMLVDRRQIDLFDYSIIKATQEQEAA